MNLSKIYEKHPNLFALGVGAMVAVCIGWLAALIIVVGKVIARIL